MRRGRTELAIAILERVISEFDTSGPDGLADMILMVDHLGSFLREVAALIWVFGILDPLVGHREFTLWWGIGVALVGGFSLTLGMVFALFVSRGNRVLALLKASKDR